MKRCAVAAGLCAVLYDVGCVQAWHRAGSGYLNMQVQSPAVSKAAAVKNQLLTIFGESQQAKEQGYDKVLASPSGVSPVRDSVRLYGAGGTLSYKVDTQGRRWASNGIYVDFVGEDAKAPWELSRSELVMEGTFQSPFVSFVYERGWRQAFAANGFPGIDKEYDLVSEFFAPVSGPSSVSVDLSCGSGLMTRRLVKGARFGRVIAADLSPSMLAEASARFSSSGLPAPELLRVDVVEMPLLSGSVDAVHAGAALHCWARLEEALKEVHRVLKPGGRFFASTFLVSATINTPFNSRGYQFFTLEKLENFMKDAGFESVSVEQNGRACALIRCIKADAEDAAVDDADVGLAQDDDLEL